jgi:hypothetical protein
MWFHCMVNEWAVRGFLSEFLQTAGGGRRNGAPAAGYAKRQPCSWAELSPARQDYWRRVLGTGAGHRVARRANAWRRNARSRTPGSPFG